ncbi:MAG: ribose 5-phosphate isomerase B [Anaerolineales bacterium]
MAKAINENELESLVANVVRRVTGEAEKTASQKGSSTRVIAIGADHRAQSLKEGLMKLLAEKGFRVTDHSQQPDGSTDYPDIAEAVATQVASGAAWRGIVIDGAGIGSCMAANKVPGARAALCYNQATARNSREHNNANVLSLGSGLTGPAMAQMILEVWLETPFAGGRHARRVDKITDIEKRYSRRE